MKKLLNSVFVIWTVFMALMTPSMLSAGENKYDIKEMTPEVKEALDNRRARFEQLRYLKIDGIVGENNQGYVSLLDRNDKDAAELVEAENKDRKFIYMTIVEQNNLPESALKTVETVFAQVQRDKASPGDKIQDENGDWMNR